MGAIIQKQVLAGYFLPEKALPSVTRIWKLGAPENINLFL